MPIQYKVKNLKKPDEKILNIHNGYLDRYEKEGYFVAISQWVRYVEKDLNYLLSSRFLVEGKLFAFQQSFFRFVYRECIDGSFSIQLVGIEYLSPNNAPQAIVS